MYGDLVRDYDGPKGIQPTLMAEDGLELESPGSTETPSFSNGSPGKTAPPTTLLSTRSQRIPPSLHITRALKTS